MAAILSRRGAWITPSAGTSSRGVIMTLRMSAKRSCIFCGGTPLTVEHVLPKWLQDVIPGHGLLTHSWRDPETGDVREWTTSLVDFKAKAVCARCNQGWLSQLEGDAKPFLSSMIRGRRRTYYDRGRELCALWALKTVMMLEYGQPEERRSIPVSHFGELYRAQAVLPDVRVWFGATTFGSGALAATRTIDLQLETGDEHGYSGTLCVGHLVFEVVRVHIGDWEKLQIQRPLDRALVPLWPVDHPVEWPPAAQLERAQVAILGQMLEHVGVHVTRSRR